MLPHFYFGMNQSVPRKPFVYSWNNKVRKTRTQGCRFQALGNGWEVAEFRERAVADAIHLDRGA